MANSTSAKLLRKIPRSWLRARMSPRRQAFSPSSREVNRDFTSIGLGGIRPQLGFVAARRTSRQETQHRCERGGEPKPGKCGAAEDAAWDEGGAGKGNH